MAGPHSGALPSDQTSRFIQFGSWIEGCYGDENRAAHTHANVTAVPGAAAHASTLVLKLPKQRQQLASAKPIDRVVIQEDQAYGQRILAWNVTTDTGVVLGDGRSIGNKRILLWNATESAGAAQLVLNVLGAKAAPIIRNFAAYRECPSG